MRFHHTLITAPLDEFLWRSVLLHLSTLWGFINYYNAKMGYLAGESNFQSNIPESADLIVAVVYSVFGICSLFGNSLLLYVSYRKKHLLKAAEFFIINLAISDLGLTLSLYPFAVTSSIFHRWLYGEAMCLIYAFCGVLFGICSLTTLTLLSTVCCLKVCYPLYGNRFTYNHSRLMVACAWAYALVFACSPLARWGVYGPEPYGTACCIDWRASNTQAAARSYTVVLFVFCFITPCGIIVASYTKILVIVRRSRRTVEEHVSPHSRLSNIQTIIVKLSVAVCIGFFTAWSPYAVVSMWAAFGHIENIPPLAFALPAMFAKSSTLYNPAIYLLLRPNFRRVMRRDLAVLWRICARGCLCAKRRTRHDAKTIAKERASPEHKQPPKVPPPARKSVRVLVRGKRNAEIDCLEITLESMPVRAKTAWQ